MIYHYRYIPLLFFILITSTLNAGDTLLVSMHSEPFFYNVICNKEGKIFTGTSEGIYQAEGLDLKKISDEKGYITLDPKNNIIINPDGIKNYEGRKFNYLLPYPEKSRDEYHAETKDYLYIVSGGTLYFFKFTHYNTTYPYHSVRTISKNWLGTYSGIYYKGKKIPDPNFCDGYIREINGKAYICYSFLTIYKMPSSSSDTLVQLPATCLTDVAKTYVYDVAYTPYNRKLYIATKGSLIEADENLEQCNIVYEAPELEITLLGEFRIGLYFAAGNQFLFRNFNNKIIDTLVTLDSPILGGVLTTLNYYLLTADGLHSIQSDGKYKKLASLQKAHTLLEINPSELVIATDQGLYFFNLADNSLSTLIPGIEFNKRGLYRDNDIVYAGSINGVYSFNVKDIRQMIDSNVLNLPESESSSPYMTYLLILFGLITGVSIAIIVRLKKKLEQNQTMAEPEPQVDLTREDIEAFIRENLATASIHSIVEHFDTNTSYVYALLEPDKPGSIIQNLRLQLIAEMRKNKAKVSDIAAATGLSESYVRKLKV